MKQFYKIGFDLFCEWRKREPSYRIYVNDELITERTFIWKGHRYLHEVLQLELEKGEYQIKLVPVGKGKKADFKIRNLACEYGEARIINSTTFSTII